MKKHTKHQTARITLYLEAPLYKKILEKTAGGKHTKTAVIENMIKAWQGRGI